MGVLLERRALVHPYNNRRRGEQPEILAGIFAPLPKGHCVQAAQFKQCSRSSLQSPHARLQAAASPLAEVDAVI